MKRPSEANVVVTLSYKRTVREEQDLQTLEAQLDNRCLVPRVRDNGANLKVVYVKHRTDQPR